MLQRLIIGTLAGLVIAFLGGLSLRPELFDFVLNYYNNRPFTLTERLLTEQRIVLHYLSQLFFPAPWRLSIEHDVVLSTSIISPWVTGPAIAMNALLVLFACVIARKQPLLSLAILFYYINHLVESTIVPLELVFEHRNYLPSLFLFVPVAFLFHNILSKLQHIKLFTNFIIVMIAFLFTAEGYATYTRNMAWQTEEALWLDALKKAPNSARPLATLALKLAWGPNPTEDKYRKAIKLTEQTLSMNMSRSRLDAAQLGNMASIYNKLGEYENAINYYQKALDLAPKDANIRYNYCKTLITTGDFIIAKQELLNLLSDGLIHADYFNMLGFVDLWIEEPESALRAIQRAHRYAPNRPDILLTLGKSLSLLGYHNRAKFYYLRAKKYGGNDSIISLCLIENALKQGHIDQARNELHNSINRFSLLYFLQPLKAKPAERYRSVPLSIEILIPFIKTELESTTSTLLP